MNKEQKIQKVAELKDKLDNSAFFYLTDASSMSVEDVNKFRSLCFAKGVEMTVVKNTLLRKAMDTFDDKGYDKLYEAMSGPTAILFSATGNIPAKLLEEFRKKNSRPLLKAAYIDSAVYIGDDQISVLTKIKSKEELVGDVIGLLQSPAKNVISALKSGGNTIAGLVKALEERASN